MAQNDEVSPPPPPDDIEAAQPSQAAVPEVVSDPDQPPPQLTPAQPPTSNSATQPETKTAASHIESATIMHSELPPEDPPPAHTVHTKEIPGHEAETPTNNTADAALLAASRRHTRRSFAATALAAATGYGFYRWIAHSPTDMEQPKPLRRALQANAALSRALFDDRALAPTYPLERAEELRVNGIYGLKQPLLAASWRLQVVGARNQDQHPRFSLDVTAWQYQYSTNGTTEDQGHDTKVAPSSNTAEKMAPASRIPLASLQQQRTKPMPRMPRGQEEAGESSSSLEPGTPGLLLTLDDLLKLPRHELVTQFKCIEGWSQIVHWAGVRMADFLDLYPPELIRGQEPRYVYMETPNGDYYTGYDMHAMRHPQTLLVTEMMGAPLTQYHGAPLRLHMPTRYGYKQIKRIGLIRYTDTKPDDYWTRLGYDWFAGL